MMARVRQSQVRSGRGSALILTVVLTSLLAIVGVLFLLATRIDKMATSATSEGRELAFAVDTLLAQINEDLVADVPGVTTNQEYYDYPDNANAWLADLEPDPAQTAADPNQQGYRWRQISNVGGTLTGQRTRDVPIQVIGERDPVPVVRDLAGRKTVDPNAAADADGDGVADAKWFQLPGETSSRGRPIYAAVRIVDNGAMLNVNTGYASGDVLDLLSTDTSTVDGSNPLQVNILALATAPGAAFSLAATTADARRLRSGRTNYASNPPEINLGDYERKVTWRYLDVLRSDPNGLVYTPFDTSDELELRYRFLLDHLNQNGTRVEVWAGATFDGIRVPRELPSELKDWFPRVADGEPPGSVTSLDPKYSYRHVATTYNMDRVITPRPLRTPSGQLLRKMLNVNAMDDPYLLRDVIKAALEEANPGFDMGGEAAQIAVNLKDYIDDDDRVTYIPGATSASLFYGFEQPCVYISEIAYRQVIDQNRQPHTSYAIELFKPYFEDPDPPSPRLPTDEWRLHVRNLRTGRDDTYPLVWGGYGKRRFQVLLAEDAGAPFGNAVSFKDAEEPVDPMPLYRRDQYNNQPHPINNLSFEPNDIILLERRVGANEWPVIDRSEALPGSLFVPDGNVRSVQRDISKYKCVWRRWSPVPVDPNAVSLGSAEPQYVDSTQPPLPHVQAHPANKPLANIGELGMIFTRNMYVYSLPDGLTVGQVLIDLTNRIYANLFNYLTVLDPAEHQIPTGQVAPDPNKAAETRIMGRINVNTVPSFVLAQLPWMRYPSQQFTDGPALQRARAIVAHRNRNGPFRSIGELMQITPRTLDPSATSDYPVLGLPLDPPGMDIQHRYSDNPRGPDLTLDTAHDDFEERDLIFQRISNLVTVRSDVFTAYILVRIGKDGPQRRVVAVLDRGRVNKRGDKVRIVTQQLVPDPR